jgi:hypothetical protein
MKFKKTDFVFLFGAVVIFAPVYFDFWPGNWWYVVILISGILMTIAGYGARMDQLGKGDTGEELLREIWDAIKKGSLKVREMFRSNNKP